MSFLTGGMRRSQSPYDIRRTAQQLQAQGRRGDKLLAHINPQEAQMLKQMGGSGGKNPVTGLLEFNEEEEESTWLEDAWDSVTDFFTPDSTNTYNASDITSIKQEVENPQSDEQKILPDGTIINKVYANDGSGNFTIISSGGENLSGATSLDEAANIITTGSSSSGDGGSGGGGEGGGGGGGSDEIDYKKKREEYWEKLRGRADLLPDYERYTGDKAALRDIASKDISDLSPDEQSAIQQFRNLSYDVDPSTMEGALQTMQKIQGFTPDSLDVTQEDVEARMNPYLSAAMERVAEQQALANQMVGFKARGSGAFGGARHGLREAETAGEMADVSSDLAYGNYMDMYDRLQRGLNQRANLGFTAGQQAYQMSQGLQDWQLGRGRMRGADLLQTGALARGIQQAKEDELYRASQAKLDADYERQQNLNRFNILEHSRVQDDPYKKLQAQTAVGAAEPIPTTTTTGGSTGGDDGCLFKNLMNLG
jgi:hypothetical protein